MGLVTSPVAYGAQRALAPLSKWVSARASQAASSAAKKGAEEGAKKGASLGGRAVGAYVGSQIAGELGDLIGVPPALSKALGFVLGVGGKIPAGHGPKALGAVATLALQRLESPAVVRRLAEAGLDAKDLKTQVREFMKSDD